MNTKTILGVIMVVVVLGSAGYLALNATGGNTGGLTATTSSLATVVPKKTTAKPSSYTTPKPPTKTTAKTVGIGSLLYLLGLRQSLVCSVKTESGTMRSGTLYVAAGMARANFTNSSMIDDGSYLYAWTMGATTGTKLPAPLGVSGSAIVSKGGVDPTTDLSFSCNPWAADASVFVPPTSVSFIAP